MHLHKCMYGLYLLIQQDLFIKQLLNAIYYIRHLGAMKEVEDMNTFNNFRNRVKLVCKRRFMVF